MEQYDLVIIGGGPTGAAAGLYSGRSRLKTLILNVECLVVNWPLLKM